MKQWQGNMSDRNVRVVQKLRSLAASLALVFASTLLSFGLAESIARLLISEWVPRTAMLSNFWQYDPVYGWAHIPNSAGHFPSADRDTEVRINAKGFRGPAVDFSRTPGHRRVVLLGDSFVWGFGVEFEETFGERLRRLLPDLEVVNLGVSGYSTDQELLVYQREGTKYRPDLVVLTVAANDFHGNQRTEEYLIYGKPAFVMSQGTLQLTNQPVVEASWIKRLVVKAAWHSYVLTGLQRWVYAQGVKQSLARTVSAAPSEFPAPGTSGTPAKFPRTEAWGLLIKLLQALHAATANDGAKLLVVFVDDIDAREAARYLATQGIETLVLQNEMRPDDSSLHLREDFHWNAEGHARVAQLLAPKIQDLMSRTTTHLSPGTAIAGKVVRQ